MTLLKPAHPAIRAYYAALKSYTDQKVRHEGALRSAFQNLLSETSRNIRWQLIPDLTDARKGIRPDGTFRDEYFIERGHWEAKDTDDDLEDEIRKKIGRGYPLKNIIFEDTRRAFLYQNGELVLQTDLKEPKSVAELLNAFYGHVEPALETFEKAIDEFKERVPDLARGLVSTIRRARKDNPKFAHVFEEFLQLCRVSLNPNLRVEAVDEMLVQHLLTERLIRRIFSNPDFNRRNVIAAEVEKVIDTLVGQSFNREEFLKSLDRFYVAIEAAAQSIHNFTDKQHFLNVVYERFFQGYSVKVADTHGIVYTPQAIVDFMCQSVEEVLRADFGTTLGDQSVHLLDPCTGTGNFMVNIVNRLPRRNLPRTYGHQLFANEVMLMPYYIAALNIEHAFFDRSGSYEPFDGLCFVDTLDMAKNLLALTEANTQRVTRQNDAPITVIIGNPPYNTAQLNENDNNKNRKYRFLDARIKDTYAQDSKATLKNKLYDPYVRFFRWASDRLENRDGIVCFVTNNSFVEETAFDGMRKRLYDEFSVVYHLDLHGDVRRHPDKTGTAFNVFGIQLGVGITVAVRHRNHATHRILYAAASPEMRREQKLAWLKDLKSINGVDWKEIVPDPRHTWIPVAAADTFNALTPLGTKDAKDAKSEFGRDVVFKEYSLGVSTNRDVVAYSFHRADLEVGVADFCERYGAEVDRWRRLKRKPKSVDDFVDYDALKWSSTLKNHLLRGDEPKFDPSRIRQALYRPFTKKHLYYDNIVVDRPGLFEAIFPTATGENRVICVPTVGSRDRWCVMATDVIPDLHVLSNDGFQAFPLYVYSSDGHRNDNVTDGWRRKLGEQLKQSVSGYEAFHYGYAVLHHPEYRTLFAEALRRDLPRLPIPKTAPIFRAMVEAGERLANLHIAYERLEPWPLKWVENAEGKLSYRVEKARLARDRKSIVINDWLTLADVPAEAFDYSLGNRSGLEWVLDQHQVIRDSDGDILSDPNRSGDPEYIVRLLGQIVRLSVETLAVIRKMPELGLSGH